MEQRLERSCVASEVHAALLILFFLLRFLHALEDI